MHSLKKNNIRTLKYSDAIREGIDQMMMKFPELVVIGEGVPDPKSIFSTTEGLRERYGKKRIFDMPLAENGMTGICIGAAINEARVLMIHQRIDFCLLAMDQLINNAAKWYYMFNGGKSVPLVVRLIIGRGWGQGPQHSQSLQALFAHIPGLKVIMPSTARDAKGMMISAIKDNNPVVFIEHRWLHDIEDDVPKESYDVPLNCAKILKEGADMTVVASSFMTLEALKAARSLLKVGIELEIVDLRSISHIDIETIMSSVSKTRNLAVLDSAWKTGGVAGEVVAQCVERGFAILERAPLRISAPDHPIPTSQFVSGFCYQDANEIALYIMNYFKVSNDYRHLVHQDLIVEGYKDVPNKDFHGPF